MLKNACTESAQRRAANEVRQHCPAAPCALLQSSEAYLQHAGGALRAERGLKAFNKRQALFLGDPRPTGG
eukprot:2455156-Prymnesium_polylepis.1